MASFVVCFLMNLSLFAERKDGLDFFRVTCPLGQRSCFFKEIAVESRKQSAFRRDNIDLDERGALPST